MDFKDFYGKFISFQKPERITDDLPSFSYRQINKQTGDAIRGRVVELLLYPDDLSHCRALQMVHELGFHFGANIHDRDLVEDSLIMEELEDEEQKLQFAFENQSDDRLHKKAHCHCVIYFSDAKTNTAVAKYFHISSNYVRVYTGADALDRRIRYLIHLGENTKYQYDESGCTGDLTRELKNLGIELARSDSTLLYDFLELLMFKFSKPQYRNKIITNAEVYQFAYSQGYSRCMIKANLNIHVNNFRNDHNDYVRSLNNENNQHFN